MNITADWIQNAINSVEDHLAHVQGNLRRLRHSYRGMRPEEMQKKAAGFSGFSRQQVLENFQLAEKRLIDTVENLKALEEGPAEVIP